MQPEIKINCLEYRFFNVLSIIRLLRRLPLVGQRQYVYLYCQVLCQRLPALCRNNGLMSSGLHGYTSLIGRESSQRESDSFTLSKCNFLSLTLSYFTAALHLASEISKPQRKTGLAEWKSGIILSHESHTCREPNKCQPMALSPKCVKEEMSIFICIKQIEGLLLFPLDGLEFCH